jgi:hypothetical protein
MTRITALAVSMFMIVMPLTAVAGGGAPPTDSVVEVAPIFALTGNSGIVIVEAGGYSAAYNMDGTTPVSTTILPNIGAGYTTLGDSDGGWPDLDGNGINDIVIQHTGGFTYAWLMEVSGPGVAPIGGTAGGQELTALPAGFSHLAWADLDGDGDTDRVIQNSAGGAYAFLMDGLTLEGSGALPQPPAGWSTLGFPDLDGANGADMVVQREDGAAYAYILNGTVISSQGQVPGLSQAQYTTIGFPDLDGINGADIVIQEAGGSTTGYIMNGVSETASGQLAGLPTAAYSTLGFPDLNGDGSDDVVIQHTGGYTVAYISDGVSAPTASGQIPGFPVTGGYSTIGFPNFDDDNGADIAIQAESGYTFAYLMDVTGLTAASSGPVPGLPATGSYTTQTWGDSWTAFDQPIVDQN